MLRVWEIVGFYGVSVVFSGMKLLNMDEKGRIPMPPMHRDPLMTLCDGHAKLTLDITGLHLSIYPLALWKQIEEMFAQSSVLDKRIKRYQRVMIGYAEDVSLDKQGRIMIPAALRDYVGLEKHVALVGQTITLDIWQAERWHNQLKGDITDIDNEPTPEELKQLEVRLRATT